MSLLVKAASAAVIVTTLAFATDAVAAPLSASLALRDAAAPRVQTVWWRGGYAYDYDYYCPPYATPYASAYYGYSAATATDRDITGTPPTDIDALSCGCSRRPWT